MFSIYIRAPHSAMKCILDCFQFKLCYVVISVILLISPLPKPANLGSPENVAQSTAPIFIDEPPSRMHFSNNTGTVITCSAHTTAPPIKLWWILADSQTIVTEVAGLRYVRPNGQLVFPPFALDQYRQDIHSTTYRCMASNTFATIRSRDCQIKAVVHQSFKMQVYDEFVIRENMAVMRCNVPNIVKDYVRVVAWLRDDQILVTSTHNPHAGRYTILSTGELLIRNASFSDSGFYRCQIRHQLTDELRTSEEAGRLIVTEPHNSVAPRIWTHTTVVCEHDSICQLICVAQSWPLATYRWFRETESGVYMPANLYNADDGGYVLSFRPATLAHHGQWICVANNSLAEEKVLVRVQVTSPLKVFIEPKQAQVDAGRPVTFNCSSTGGPPIRPPMWFYNGKSMINIFREHVRDQRIRLIESHILHITTVRRQDVGAYQCVVQSEQDEAQATVELKLGDVAPLLLETFAERQIVEPNSVVSLRCVVTGTPLPQIRWFLDGQPIPNLSRFRTGDHVTSEGKVVSFVNITNIRVVDGGQYSCVAENEVGSASFNGLILVTGGPTLRTSFWGHHHNQSVVAGMNAIIRCPVVAYPIESIVWEHNKNILPVNHRQSIDPIIDGYGGTLRIKDVHSFQDSGEYICMVKVPNSESRSPRGIVQMNVHYAPKIDRHSLPKHLQVKQGDRIKLMCSVIEGDQPIEIEWIRNNKIVKSSEQISINNGEEYSLLTFKNVHFLDSDKWTCRARNGFASDNSTIEIVVNVPPKWIHEPKNAKVILGRSLTLNCQAEGFPKPKIIWKKAVIPVGKSNVNEIINFDSNKVPATAAAATSNNNNDFRDILSSYRYQVFSNGSLFIQETETSDTGLYMCQISNGIGVDLSKVIQIQVQQPPKVDQKFSTETVIKGNTATIQCRSEGDPILVADWKRDMQHIDSSQNQRYVIKEDNTPNSIVSYLEIIDTGRLDSALFTCTISNNFGSDICNVQLIVQEVPEPPRDVSVSEITSRSAKIKWKPSFAGNSAIIGFIVQYKPTCFNDNKKQIDKRNPRQLDSMKSSSSMLQWKELYINDANAQSFILRELYPWCSYQLQMKAQNSIGLSDPSQTIAFKTAEEMPGGPPLDVSVEPLSSNSLKIKWRPPDKYLQFGQIKGYYIGYRIVDNGNNRFLGDATEQYAYKNVEANIVESNVYEVAYLTNLKKHTLYSVVVQAFNSAGAGPRSDEITVRTLNIQKQNTIVLEVLTTDVDSITLHWDIDDYSSNENDFVLHISEEGTGKWIEKKLPGQLRRHTETNLKCGTKYLLYMTFASQHSQTTTTTTGEMITTRTKGTVAISPSIDEFLTINDTAVSLNFDSWHSGGCQIQNFTIKYRQHQQNHWKIIGTIRYDAYGHKTLTINNLEPDQYYILSVTASSAAGMTEAIYNFTTSNTSTMIFRLSPPDIASYEYSANAPFHNVTIMLPIVISVIVLVAVLTTLIAFLRKQEILREHRECISNSSQNLHLRSSSIRSKDDINEMISYPMVDYHTLCQTPKNNINNNNGKSQEGNPLTASMPNCNAMEGIYSKALVGNSTMLYSPSSKRTVICENVLDSDQAIRHGGQMNNNRSNLANHTHVTVNSHHIYAEPNPSSLQPYAQPRCIVTDMAGTNEDSLMTTINGCHSNEKFCALVNNTNTNTHL